MPPPPPPGHDPKSCLRTWGQPHDDDYGQIDAKEKDATNYKLRGVRVHMYASRGAWCQRISSIQINAVGGVGFFEFGWIRGWWGTDSCSGVDHDRFYTRPTLFNERRTRSGHYSCSFWPNRHPGSGSIDVYRASDVNANTYWGSFFNGTELQPQGVDLDFSHGFGLINMERGGPSDAGWADFLKINENHRMNGWSYFDNVREYYDVDPDYHFKRFNPHHGKMVK